MEAKAAKAVMQELLMAALAVREELAAQTQVREDKAEKEEMKDMLETHLVAEEEVQVTVD